MAAVHSSSVISGEISNQTPALPPNPNHLKTGTFRPTPPGDNPAYISRFNACQRLGSERNSNHQFVDFRGKARENPVPQLGGRHAGKNRTRECNLRTSKGASESVDNNIV
jgi:hypothetical protein